MKILVIEDDIFFQHFYVSKLREQHFEVEEAANGEEGIEKARAYMPDIILLDLIMPIKDGFEVLEELPKDQLLKAIPVLVFSTLGSEKDIEKAMQLGAKDYINKSFFDFEALVTKIQMIASSDTK